MIKLNARKLRTTDPTEEQLKEIKRNQIYLVLDSVLDTYNVGAIFRLADAVAAEKIFLCGETETPPNPKIKKASVSTWKWVPWEYAPTAKIAIEKVKSQIPNLEIVAIEQHRESIRFDKYEYKFPICLIAGNETYGVSKEVLEIADAIVELPMQGVNKSLNVMVSTGIVLYKIMESVSQKTIPQALS